MGNNKTALFLYCSAGLGSNSTSKHDKAECKIISSLFGCFADIIGPAGQRSDLRFIVRSLICSAAKEEALIMWADRCVLADT